MFRSPQATVRQPIARVAQAAVLAIACLGTAHAGLTTYTSAASFTPLLVPGFYLEGDWPNGDQGVSYFREGPSPANTFSLTASAPGNIFNSGGALATNRAADAIAIVPSANTAAFGADVFASGINGAPIAGDINITVTTNLGATATLARNQGDRFAGFVADGAGEHIVSVTIGPGSAVAGGIKWPTADNLYLGASATSTAKPVPSLGEWGTLLLAAALAAFGWRRTRRA